MKKFTALLLALVMLMALAACGNNDEEVVASATDAATEETAETAEATDDAEAADEDATADGEKIAAIKEAGQLVLGTEAFFGPYEFHADVDGVDTIVGFDIALAQRIADELGVELVIQDMAFDVLLQQLEKGSVDLVIAGLSPSPERAEIVDFTDAYYAGSQSFIIRSDDTAKYDSFDDFVGLQVAAQQGSIQALELLPDNTPECIPVMLPTNPDIFMQLDSGKVEGAYIETAIFKAAEDNYPNLVEMCEVPYDVDGSAAAVAKGNEDLLEFCNKVIAEAIESGDMDTYVADASALFASLSETAE